MNLSKQEDKQLVSLYIEGQEKAFEVLLNRHKNKIYNYIFMKIRDEALSQDIFQETFIKVIKTLKKGAYNEEGKFLPWAMRIAHNLMIDHFRKTNKVRMISESSSRSEDYNIFDMLELQDNNVEDEMIHNELVSQMVELIDHLPDSQRDILNMRIFKEMSFKDIARKENVSINTALGRMRYALINIRKLIEKHNILTPLSQ
ncbi:sigma-70 family RNA polymerase sigma factor [Brumimicrobium glaciale]|jgi:RNA polymerase sigma-70 factor (ECF subfamily)|uniref:Sigma-70 family RNA polymerase sigma factor n=1 Tax=Brumimicrobium glaciale TaxID=200475 RepID=A0A4Q4KJC8_9FLAO|nr:sigma-70 family RNA polymerase sigma factor [Brumimicrobium glaciale]RYM33038.1 sigma-70 family RNA polymerase sigma factor [Brumimicrobium glaciale]